MTSPLDDAAAVFAAFRSRLFGIAYRVLGSAADADDVLQDAWLRWQATDRSAVRDPGAFLRTTVTRLAINVLQSARARRESYVGQWLPEPIDDGAVVGHPGDETIDLGVLLLMERLSPRERAAYVLGEAFDYPYAQIAEALQVSEANARQIARRARDRLGGARRERVGPREHRALLDAFLAAARSGDVASLESMLAEDAVSTSDGGGAVHAARLPLVGRTRVARFVAKAVPRFGSGVAFRRIEANWRPALLLTHAGVRFGVLAIRATASGIHQVLWMMNPAKLRRLSADASGSAGDPSGSASGLV